MGLTYCKYEAHQMLPKIKRPKTGKFIGLEFGFELTKCNIDFPIVLRERHQMLYQMIFPLFYTPKWIRYHCSKGAINRKRRKIFGYFTILYVYGV